MRLLLTLLLLAATTVATAAPRYLPRTPRDRATADALPSGQRDRAEAVRYAPAPAGVARVAVLRIDFADAAGDGGHTQAFYENLAFGTAAGALNHYWREASYGQLSLTGTVSTNWLRSAQTKAYWGANSAGGLDDANAAIAGLAQEAVLLADAAGFDFSPYDVDADGTLDYLVIVHAGSGEELTWAAGDIFSHSGTIPGGVVVDGVTASQYILVAEDSPLGLWAHEFGHALGLPDLYNTATGTPVAGEWELMDQGMWNGITPGSIPAHPSAWGKLFLGWLDPLTLWRQDAPGHALGPWSDTPAAVKLVLGDSEYILVENRQQRGYDAWLPNEGLLVWHCDDRIGSLSLNNLNAGVPRRVELLEADGTESVWDDGGDPFPGTTGKTFLSDTTTPSLRRNDGLPGGLRIVNIAFAGDTAFVDFLSADTSMPVLTLLTPAPGLCTSAVQQLRGVVRDELDTPVLVTLRTVAGDSTLAVAADGSFAGTLTLARGINTCTLAAADSAGNSGLLVFGLYFSDRPVAAPAGDSAVVTVALAADSMVAIPQGATDTLTAHLGIAGGTLTVTVDWTTPAAGQLLGVRYPTAAEYALLLGSGNRGEAGAPDSTTAPLLALTVYDTNGNSVGDSTAPYDGITLTFTYACAPALAATLRIYWFDGEQERWRDVLQVPGLALSWPDGTPAALRQDATAGTIAVRVAHLSFYGVFPALTAPAPNLSLLRVFPNPYKPFDGNPATGMPYDGNVAGMTGIRLTNLPNAARITIYDVAGQQVAEVSGISGTGTAVWDARNGRGAEVASGIYLIAIEANGAIAVLPVAIIR